MLRRPRTLAVLALALALPAVATAQARSIDPYGRPGASPVELDRGLVASYPLDGDAVDRVTRRPARVVGARPLEGHDGRPRGALWFDGARAWVVLGDTLQLPRFTIAAWIRPDATDRVMAIVSKIRNLPGHYEKNLELRLDPGGRLFLHVPGGGDWDAAQGQRALEPGRWVHVAATYDGRRAQLWVDGVRDGAPLEVAYAQTRTETFIGARPEGGGRDGRTPAGPTFAFQGGIEDVNFWDRALGDAELLAVAGRAPPPSVPPMPYPPPGVPGPDGGAAAALVAWYPLDGDAGDRQGRADGRIVGKARPAEDRGGDPAGALAFSGRDYVDLGQRAEPDRFTIAAWVRPARTDREQVIFSKVSSAEGPRDRWLELRIDAGGKVALAIPGGGYGSRAQGVRTPRAVAKGQWVHVAATFDGERAAIFLDGSVEAEASLQRLEGSKGPAFLGARPDATGARARLGTGLEGRLDDVRVYRGAIADDEVAALAHERTGGPGGGRPGRGGDDEEVSAFLVKVDRLLAQFDAACVRRSADLVARVEARILEELERAEQAARAERSGRIAGYLRRAAQELQAGRGRTDPMSLDRKRSALSGLAESLWNDLAQDLDDQGLRPGAGVRRDDLWY
ncbi:LamG domain-containing protein [Anaeromyxobacter terrae]|uniref:LamG domain-containing protein n=1 Tax=Anaeromyxobacter terrae TaxID=2925406 RepID=UPI001F570F44|nr:LamG domain-containing protein [Anaeromyxobacter sp. SG22]